MATVTLCRKFCNVLLFVQQADQREVLNLISLKCLIKINIIIERRTICFQMELSYFYILFIVEYYSLYLKYFHLFHYFYI